MIEQVNQLKQGSIISESSHDIVNRVSGSNAWLTHFEGGEEVQIGMSYLKNYTNSVFKEFGKIALASCGFHPLLISKV